VKSRALITDNYQESSATLPGVGEIASTYYGQLLEAPWDISGAPRASLPVPASLLGWTSLLFPCEYIFNRARIFLENSCRLPCWLGWSRQLRSVSGHPGAKLV